MAATQRSLGLLDLASTPTRSPGRGRPSEGDRELVEAVRSGDGAAFSMLYRTHCRAVLQVVRAHVHEREAAADLVQEAFVRALERLPTLRQAEKFRPWLLAIARHAAIDRRRTRWRERGFDEADGDEMASTSPSPDQQAELAELVALVNGCLADLMPRDATALVMVTHLDSAPADVAAVLGVTPGAAKVIVHRARRRLRDALTLQLLAGHKTTPCASLGALLDLGDLVGAGRHVRTCQCCVKAAAGDLELSTWSPPSTSDQALVKSSISVMARSFPPRAL